MAILQLLKASAGEADPHIDHPDDAERSESLLDAYSAAVVGAVDRVGPSVAHLEVWSGNAARQRSPRADAGSGSGFVFTPDGFYRSGDLMRQHPSGNYIVEGRKKDLINRGGEKISAEEIENIILSHPAVKDVACIPVADPDMGERMCACVLLREGAAINFEELKRFLLGKEIAKFKFPERLEILPDFPLSNFGKVSKAKLVELVSQKIALEQLT